MSKATLSGWTVEVLSGYPCLLVPVPTAPTDGYATARRAGLWRRKSDGRMVTRVLDQQGNQMIAETTVLAAGSVADDSITAVWRMGWVVAQYVNGSGSLITIRSQDGVTYS